MTQFLTAAQNRMHAEISTDLRLARRIVLGMDCWSKKSLTASYLAISASFFHPSRHIPVHILLSLHQIAHPHTGSMLADKLNETLHEWGIERSQILVVVTDNGSNMVKAVRMANEQQEAVEDADEGESDIAETESEEPEEEPTEPEIEVDTNLYRFPCLAHTLQLVLKELGKNQAYTNLVTKVRAVVRAVKISSVAQEKLIAACGQTVIKDCTTRWNSILMVIDRLLAIRPQVEEVLREMKIDSLTNSEWARLSDVQKLLTPFKSQTDSLQTDTLSLSYVIPSLL